MNKDYIVFTTGIILLSVIALIGLMREDKIKRELIKTCLEKGNTPESCRVLIK